MTTYLTGIPIDEVVPAEGPLDGEGAALYVLEPNTERCVVEVPAGRVRIRACTRPGSGETFTVAGVRATEVELRASGPGSLNLTGRGAQASVAVRVEIDE